jgi:hypothetical protein
MAAGKRPTGSEGPNDCQETRAVTPTSGQRAGEPDLRSRRWPAEVGLDDYRYENDQ